MSLPTRGEEVMLQMTVTHRVATPADLKQGERHRRLG
jgi:hypothetical protein